jgi:hypothetical protein
MGKQDSDPHQSEKVEAFDKVILEHWVGGPKSVK